MTTYYEFDPDSFVDYGIKKSPALDSELSFIEGQKINERMPPLFFEANFPLGERPPHYMGDTIPLASKQLIDTLRAAGVDNFQVFEAKVFNPETGEKWDNYYAFNVIGLVKAAVLERSDYDTIMGDDPEGIEMPLIAFNEIVLDKNKLRDLLIFRMAESPGTLIVHENVVKALEANLPSEGWGIDSYELELV